jgi:nitrite reductase (NO-forming)
MATVTGGQGASPASPSATEGGAAASEGLIAVLAVGVVLALTFGLAALVLAGDGDGDSPAGRATGPVEEVAVELGDLFVEPDRVEIPSGSHLQVEVTNGGDLVHDLTLEGETGTDRLETGETQTADFGVIDADTQAWCTVPGHKEAGMLLDIVVTEPVPETTTTTAPAGA